MTRPAKKEHETRLARQFLDGFINYTSLETDERPDFRVRRSEGDFGLEVTEYHPQELGTSGKTRVADEACWWRYLWPLLDSERRKRSLRNIQVHLRFADSRLPGKREAAAVARELAGAVAAAVANPCFAGDHTAVEFIPAAQIDSLSGIGDGTVFLSLEAWPEMMGRLQCLTVYRQFLDWPSWACQNATTSWIGPEAADFKRILEDKAKAAKDYSVAGLPLWLLIVCDVIDDGAESHGDLASHIFPSGEAERDELMEKLEEAGFCFESGPFTQVWLFSSFMRRRLQLYPR